MGVAIVTYYRYRPVGAVLHVLQAHRSTENETDAKVTQVTFSSVLSFADSQRRRGLKKVGGTGS